MPSRLPGSVADFPLVPGLVPGAGNPDLVLVLLKAIHQAGGVRAKPNVDRQREDRLSTKSCVANHSRSPGKHFLEEVSAWRVVLDGQEFAE